jgi:hypothetical protein
LVENWDRTKILQVARTTLQRDREMLKGDQEEVELQIQLRLQVLKAILDSKVSSIGHKRDETLWKRRVDKHETIYWSFKNQPTKAVLRMFGPVAYQVHCTPYVQLCILKANIMLASAALRSKWDMEWKGKTVNKINGIGKGRFYQSTRAKTKADQIPVGKLLPGDNIRLYNPFYDTFSEEEIGYDRTHNNLLSGQEGSNVFYIGSAGKKAYILALYSHNVWKIEDYQQEVMAKWESVTAAIILGWFDGRCAGISNDPREAFWIKDRRQPILTTK